MTQITTLSLTAFDQDPNGVGAAPGFNLSLPADFDDVETLSSATSLFGLPLTSSLALNIGLTGTLAATQGNYNISYPIDVNAQFATAVSDGQNISIDTSQYTVNMAMVTLTGPGTTASLTVNDALDGGIEYGPSAASIDVDYGQTYALTQSPSFGSAYGSLTFAFPSPFTQASTASSGTDFLPAVTVSGADSPVVTASIDLANIAAAIYGVPLSGTLGALDGAIGYVIASAPLTGAFSIGQTFSFDPTEVLVSMSDGMQTDTGTLGSTFNFLAPGTGSGTLDITATYTLEGTLTDLYGIVGTFSAALNALSVTAGPVTIGPVYSQTVTTGPLDLATGYPVTTPNVSVPPGMATYEVAYGPNAGQNASGADMGSASGTVASGNGTTTYTASAILSASMLSFTDQRVGELEPEELAVLVTFASSNPDPGGIGLSVNQSGSSLPGIFNVSQNVTGLNQTNTLGTLMVAESANAAGSFAGMITLGVSYDGGPPTPETIAASETIYNIAGVSISGGVPSSGPIDLGTFRVGDTPSLSVTITNTAAAGPYTDTLISGANEEGIFTLDNTVALAGGATGTVGISLDTSTDGSFTVDGDIFGLLSHDASLPDEGIYSGAQLSAEIYQTATVGIVMDQGDDSAMDTLTQTGADSWVYNLGIINLGGNNAEQLNFSALSIENTATAALSDLLGGTVTEFGDTEDFSNFGADFFAADSGTFSSLEAGASTPFDVVSPNVETPGTYAETLIIDPDSVDGGGTLALAPATVTIEETIANDAPQIAPIVGAGGASASAVSTGVVVTGTLTNVDQEDWIAISLVAGQAYEIAVDGLSSEAQVGVVRAGATDAATGVLASFANAGISGAAENYTYVDAASTGLYDIDLTDPLGGVPETYDVSAAPVLADYADNETTAATVKVGGSLTGTLSNIGQDDWIAVSLNADQGYEIAVTGLGYQGNVDILDATDTVSPAGVDAALAQFFGAETLSPGTFDAYFMPTIAGTYFVDVSDGAATAGLTPYTVAVAAVTPFVADNASTTGSLAVGQSLTGTLANIDEDDWFAVSLTANQAYEVTVNGLSDLAQLQVGASAALPANDVAIRTSGIGQDGAGTASAAYFMPAASGTYYISLQDPGAAAGTSYSVSLAAVSADYTDNASAPGHVTVGGSVTGTLANIGQTDWIAVSLTADQAYEIATGGLSQDAQIVVQNGALYLDDIEYDFLSNSTLALGGLVGGEYGATVIPNDAYFMPTASGVYDIAVEDPAATTATPYTLSVAAVSADDTDNASAPGHIAVGGTTTGTLANIGQDDWIAATLTANQAYEFTVAGLSGGGDVLVQNGQTIDAAFGIPADETLAAGDEGVSDTYFMPATSGVYYLDLEDQSAITPETYSVSLAAVASDYPDNPTTKGLVIPDGGEQIAAPGAATRPFAGLAIGDASGETLVLTIASSNAANGTLSNLSGGTYDEAAGTYSLFGSPAAVSAALQALTFTPVAGAATTTNFQISVLDVDGVYAADGAVSVVTGQNLAAGAALTLYGPQNLSGYVNDGTLGLVDATLSAAGVFTNNGVVDVDPSRAIFEGAVTGTGTIDIAAGSDVTFDGSVAATQTIVFQGTTGTLTLNDPHQFEAAVIGTGVTQTAACYARGTSIMTPRGEMRIETLRTGDLVCLARGGAAPVKWIGERAYEGRFIAGDVMVLPVTLRAGALADGVPARDLTVSPAHGIWWGCGLIPAWRLINGVSIVQAPAVARVHYLHVELWSHEVIFAEGCPAESFYDAQSRGQFQNVAAYRARFSALPPVARLPLIEQGFALAAAQRDLAARAGLTPPAAAPAGPTIGYVDDAGETIAGWAVNTLSPAPVTRLVFASGRIVAKLLANLYRPDLRAAGFGDGCHGFSIPRPPGARGPLALRVATTGVALPYGPAARAA